MEARLGPLRVVGFRRDLGTPVRGTLLGRPGQMGSPLGGQGQAWEGEEGWWVCQEKCPLAGGAKGMGGVWGCPGPRAEERQEGSAQGFNIEIHIHAWKKKGMLLFLICK